MTEQPLQDQTARDRIKHELDINFMVQAGAGAGKTYSLVGRMVEVITTGHAQIENIAAITFTRKAAGEMRGRFFDQLRKRHQAEQDPEIINRVQQALRNIDRCFIGTIHAFCSRLLRERPVEAGLSPDFTELEERDEEIIRSEFWHGYLQQCFGDDDPALNAIDTLGIHVQNLYTFFKERCRFNDLPLKPTHTDKPDFERAKKATIDLLNEALGHIPNELSENTDTFMETLAQADHMRRYRNLDDPAICVPFLKLFSKKNAGVTQKKWAPNQAYAKSLVHDKIPHLQEQYITPLLTQWKQYVYTQVAAFIDQAVLEYDTHRQQQAQLTFQDLLLKATALLRTNSEIRAFFKARYHCLFIDEFQDTDPIQAEMLFYLTGSDIHEQDWQKLCPEPGRLFLVGDEKQAIYRFRRADVETFRLVSKRIQETQGDVLSLTTSFRTLGAPIDWINTAFETLFKQEDPHYQSLFEPLSKHKPQGLDKTGIRKITIPKISRNPREPIAQQEAEAVVSCIRAAIDGTHPLNYSEEEGPLSQPASPGDFLILTRTRKMLPIFTQLLEAAGIPYDVTGGGHLADTDEFRALLDVLETIQQPENPLPLIAYLRGSLVGLGDDEIYRFRQAHGAFNYTFELRDGLPNDLKDTFAPIFDRLNRIRNWLITKSPASAFELLLAELGLRPFASIQSGGSSRAGNLQRLLSLIHNYESQGWHWSLIVDEMRAMAEEDDYNVEELTLDSGREDVVRLMNLHQAKGLEGRVVFLVDSGDNPRDREPAFHVRRTGTSPYLSMPIRIQRGFQWDNLGEPEGWEEDAEEEKRFLSAEVLRLIYVAATRPENMLVISHYLRDKPGGPWDVLYPFLDNIPELEQPSASPTVQPQKNVNAPQKAKDDRTQKWTTIHQPTYFQSGVTEDAQQDNTAFFTARESRGQAYGRAIHELFGQAIQGHLPSDESAFIERLLKHEGKAEYLQDAMDALKHFQASDIWQEFQSANEVYTEVPFAYHKNKGQQTGVLRGIIDLIYKIDGGWKIVDFKTDGISEADLPTLQKQYAEQVELYAQNWQNITGQTVTEKGLWSTQHNIWLPIA